MPVHVTCDTCGKGMKRSPSDLRPAMFCSHACCAEWKRTRIGELAGGFRNGTRLGSNGRMKIRRPDHHRADSIGYVYRYQLVMEEKLGRPLLRSEVVHHIDGDPTNDNEENLMLFPSEAEHQRFHGKKRGGINGR